MIWYLLYPIRGTTEPPVLSPSHPLRLAFERYGRYAARHVVTTLLISAAVATMLIYPIPFLFTNDFINGASNLPHHVWTVAQPLPYNAVAEPDIIMRSAWIHGSYMEVLDPQLLASALDLQDELLGDTKDFNPLRALDRPVDTDVDTDTLGFLRELSPSQRDALHIINDHSSQSWFFHSPLQYWNCDRDTILLDPDAVATVNRKKTLSTSVNVTLRHSVVFSGKRFESRRLVAADALVITLLHRRDSPVGQQWAKKAAMLAEQVTNDWDVYPSDGRISSSRLYEFQFRPISLEDTVTLALGYGLAIGYFLMSLSKMRAVKSKIGLMTTVVTQIIITIMSSFTVCAVFNVDLSRIPSAAYPLVILAVSLENIFRLINAVLITPSEDSTSSRIGEAFGETAPVSLASSVQNIAILAILSRWVSPGVAGFCTFLAVAIFFDVFYMSTFFLSVLSVDVRRTELSDTLAKAALRSQHHHATDPNGRRPWFEQIFQGKTALSTRIAGTFVMIGFVLVAQWHFFDQEMLVDSPIGLFGDLDSANATKSTMLEGINQARSPTSWLRLQDHETAQELINIIKPKAHSYVAQVYEPLVFVKKGSDRKPRSKEPALLPAAYDFINHEMTQFTVIVILVVAVLRLFISYLLWEDEGSREGEWDDDDTPLLSVKTFPEGHSLDIAMIATSSDGHLVSVGLDRSIRVWDVRSGTNYALSEGGSVASSMLFPVLAIAIDDESRWLALLSRYRVAFFNLSERTWGASVPVDLGGYRPEAAFFSPTTSNLPPLFIIVRKNGTLIEFNVEQGEGSADFVICPSPLVCAEPVVNKGTNLLPWRLSVVTASKYGCVHRRGCVHVASRHKNGWESREVPLSSVGYQKPHQIVSMPALGVFLVASVYKIFIFNAESLEILHIIHTEAMRPRSLQCAYSYQRLYVGTPGMTTSTISYVGVESGDCILHTFVPCEDFDCIGLRSSSSLLDDEGCEWSEAKETIKRVRNPGHFKVLTDASLVGVRRKLPRDHDFLNGAGGAAGEGLRNRFANRGAAAKSSPKQWEAWTRSPPSGRAVTHESQLIVDDEERGSIFICDVGPKVKVGLMSAAFCFGNTIRLVTVGAPERFDIGPDDAEGWLSLASRRRKVGNATKMRTWNGFVNGEC